MLMTFMMPKITTSPRVTSSNASMKLRLSSATVRANPNAGLHRKIFVYEWPIAAQPGRSDLLHHPPVLNEQRTGGRRENQFQVLLHQQDRQVARRRDRLQDPSNLLHGRRLE